MKSNAVNSIKTFLATRFSLLYYFYSYLKFRLFVLLGLNFLMVVMDGLGLTMFVPLLSLADNPEGMSGDSSDLAQYTVQLFTWLHVPLNIVTMLSFILLIFLVKAVFSFFTMAYQTEVLQFFAKAIRVETTTGLGSLSYREFISTDVGRLHNTLSGESNLVAIACTNYLNTIKNVLIVIVYLGFSFILDWKFSFIVMTGGLISNLLYSRFYSKTKNLSRKITGRNHDYTSLLIQNVNSFKYLKATGRTELFKKRLLNVLDELVSSQVKVGRLSAFLGATREPIMILVICFAIGVQLLFFESKLAEIMIILVLFYRAMAYILNLQVSWNTFLANSGAVENMRTFMKFLVINKESFNGRTPVQQVNEITLTSAKIQFGETVVLNAIDLKVQRNESVAFVGESGSGKTTLVNVLSGLLKLDEGQLKINGCDVTEVSMQDYRSKIGYISQEPVIFNADIFDNVTFWAERNQDNIARFNQVVKDCSLNAFVDSLPEAYNSMLGNNGLNVSGGQKQRISIARELYRDIDVLILDEATSALDSATEAVIKESIEDLKGKLTIITIAHRLSTIQNSDCIYLLKDGRIEASGSFSMLKSKSEYFKKMTVLQGM